MLAGERYDPLKRAIDIVGSSVALIVFAPLIALTAAAVRLRIGSPVLFRQERPGRHGVVFQMTKFRSMLDGDGSDEERLTPFGRRLRSTSLDELPELMHVLRGEMSLVGPRPLLVDYLPRYDARQSRRHEVRPGITGLAQVTGRNEASWADRFELDVRYVETRSLRLDLCILFRTVGRVVLRSGVSANDHATSTRFDEVEPA